VPRHACSGPDRAGKPRAGFAARIFLRQTQRPPSPTPSPLLARMRHAYILTKHKRLHEGTAPKLAGPAQDVLLAMAGWQADRCARFGDMAAPWRPSRALRVVRRLYPIRTCRFVRSAPLPVAACAARRTVLRQYFRPQAQARVQARRGSCRRRRGSSCCPRRCVTWPSALATRWNPNTAEPTAVNELAAVLFDSAQ
jgi:hypothetical protein